YAVSADRSRRLAGNRARDASGRRGRRRSLRFRHLPQAERPKNARLTAFRDARPHERGRVESHKAVPYNPSPEKRPTDLRIRAGDISCHGVTKAAAARGAREAP